MSLEDMPRPMSPAVSSADANNDWILWPHDSSPSTQAAAIDLIREELNSLSHSEAVIAQRYAEFLEKNDGIELAKEREQLSELEAKIADLREELDVEPGEAELKLLIVSNFVRFQQRNQAARKLEESPIGFDSTQDTVEDEVKEVRHVEGASETSKKQVDANTQQKPENILLVQGYMAELDELESGGGDRVQGCLDTTPPKLGLSATTSVYTTPVEVEGEETEIEELIKYLSAVEMEKDVLLTRLVDLGNAYHKLAADCDAEVEQTHALHETNFRLSARNDNLISQLEAQMRAKDYDTEQQVAQARAEVTAEYQARIDALEAQQQRTNSIFSDPFFVASLRNSNASRSRNPTAPCSNPCCTGSVATSPPEITLHIILEPSDTRLLSLLRHVGRSLFATSILAEGPERLMWEFLASIEQADREFREQAQRVARLERAAMEDFEILRERFG